MNDLARYYDTLEIKPGASITEVSKAYQELISVWQPDRFAHDPRLQAKVQEKLIEINVAFGKLMSFQEANHRQDGSSQIIREQPFSYQEKGSRNLDEKTKATEKPMSESPRYAQHQTQDAHFTVHEVRNYVEVLSETPRPWIRFWARLFDIYFIGILVGLSAAFLLPKSILDDSFILYAGGLIVIFVYEALIMSAFGTTLGKYLLNIRVTKANGSALNFGDALKRGMHIWVFGLALGIPIVFWITMFCEWQRLGRERKTAWDNKYNFTVWHGPIGAPRVIIFTVLFIVLLCLIVIGNKGIH